MINIICDRCERTISVPREQAGTKLECPDCGDVNIVPKGEKDPPDAATDRATALGLPPDAAPETRIALVRPSLWRSRPFTFALLAFGPIAITILAFAMGWGFVRNIWWWALPVSGWLILFAGWFVTSMFSALEITNKRTVERRGLLSRRTSEVLHDHVRNIEISQSFLNRITRVGELGISSAGQSGVEIHVHNVPNPHRLRKIIDAYRPL